ncbi:hypothetical protein [Nostoc sp.]|uniref:hypothetical protein n=1 Tax=Nostoc sp. TaxID=1180 RepID=UPI0035944963
METISLQDFIKKYWHISDISSYPNGMDVVDSIRQKEKSLYKFLPPQLIRRLDAAFARSNYLKSGSVILFHDFVEPNVRNAAIDLLHNYTIYILESEDSQQLGLAVKNYE